jgi:V/A-type H+-transporting ATPase subunit I
MIIPMKKVSLLTLDKYREKSLIALRRLGVLHVKYLKPPSSADTENLEKKIEDTENALLILSKYPPDDRKEKQIDQEGISSCVTKIISLSVEKQNCLESRERILNKIAWYEERGEFSLSNLAELGEYGIYIRLYKCSRKELGILRKSKLVEVIKKQANYYHIAVVSYRVKEEIKLQEVTAPTQDLEILKRELRILEDKISSIDNSLTEKSGYKMALSNQLNYLKKSLDFHRVKSSMQEEAEICYLQGFIPVNEVRRLVDLAN